MNISKLALANSKLIYYFIAILIIGGVLSYNSMSKLEDPAVKVKQAMVVTTYPGASSFEVELQVSDLLEKSISSMKNVKTIESRSSANLSIITVTLQSTVPDSEIEQYWDLLRRKVSDTQSKLPDGTSSSIMIDDYGDVYGMFYALSADNFSNHELAKYAELIKQEVQNIDGISNVTLYGVYPEVINISIKEDILANLGVAPTEIIQTITGQNKSIYSGYYDSDGQQIRVTVNDKYKNTKDLENLIIMGHEGDQIRLKDIAKVEEGYADPIRNSMSYDKKPSIGISISALEGTDITKLGAEVEDKLVNIRDNRLPNGIEYHKVFFQPERVKESINVFLINLLESVAIVIIVLMFAMGIRGGILLGTTLIVTVIGSILFLNLFGGTLQRVSLAAFILAMGMLVDNAIVIVDGILLDLKRGRLRSKSLTTIGQKTAMPLLGATLIAILAFFPVFLSPDTAGVYIRDLFTVLAVSLFLSWILSLTLAPLQAKYMLKSPKNRRKKTKETFVQRGLHRTLKWALHHPTFTIISALALIAGSIHIYRILPQSFFPDMKYNQLYIEYKLPENASSEQTQRDVDSITSYLMNYDNVTHVTSSVGATPSRYNLVRSIAIPSMSYGDLIVEFTDEETLVNSIPKLQQYLTDNYPQAYVRVKRYNLMYSRYPIEAMFKGSDPAVLRDLTRQAQEIMERNDKTMLVTSDWEQKILSFEIDYNQSIARSIGLSRQDIGLSLLASTDGIPTSTIYEGNTNKSLVVKCVDENGEQISALENAPIFSLIPSLNSIDKSTVQGLLTGAISKQEVISEALATTPLRQAIDGINIVWEDPVIIRHNGQRAMRAQCNNIPELGAEDVRKEIKDEIEAIELPEGYSLSWEGEYSAKNESLKYLFANLPLAIILMIGILIMLFKDYRKPIIILLCVPLLFVGAVLGVWISGKAFGFVAICGILGLIGMMIKNGVVLMDEINLQIRSGKEIKKAIIDSSMVRLRPVMMASLTTILGMIPLLPDDMFGSLAATIMGGLLIGTIVTLVFIPVLYSLFFKPSLKKQ